MRRSIYHESHYRRNQDDDGPQIPWLLIIVILLGGLYLVQLIGRWTGWYNLE